MLAKQNTEYRKQIRELITGSQYHGRCLLGPKEISAEIYCFDDCSDIGNYLTWFLETETGEIVSLHRCFAKKMISGVRSSDKSDFIYRHRISASMAVVGNQNWDDYEKLKSVSFRIPGVKECLWDMDELEKMRTDELNFKNLEILSCNVGYLNIKASYTPSFNMLTGLDSFDFVFNLEFEEPVSLYQYLKYVLDVTAFFSFLAKEKLQPSDIRALKYTTASETADEENQNDPWYEFLHLWGEFGNWQDRSYQRLPILVRRVDEEKNAISDFLAHWMSRNQDWDRCYSAMMGYLGGYGKSDAERILAICRWLEEIPNARARPLQDKSKIDEVANLAAKRCCELEVPELAERVQDAVKKCNTESRRENIRRLVDELRRKFGSEIFDEHLCSHIMEAYKNRGRAAHGTFEIRTDTEAAQFEHSMYALETFCAAQMVNDIEIPESAVQRMKHHGWFSLYRCRK